MSRLIDLMHLGRDRVIGAYEVDGVVVDPGPASCVDTLLEGLGGEAPRALLLTHIHLDHAGATGVLVRRFPQLAVYVHERGAPHLADPAKLLKSARQLYGDDMDRLWGEVAAVPLENITELSGEETVLDAFEVTYAPGHASHHVAYLHAASGDAYVGDVAGVRAPPSDLTVAPTPPPDIDLEAWKETLDAVQGLEPAALCLTHFGRVDDVGRHLDRVREALDRQAGWARDSDEAEFVAALRAEIAANADSEAAASVEQAAPPDQLWLGLERYWRKRGERDTAAAAEGGGRK